MSEVIDLILRAEAKDTDLGARQDEQARDKVPFIEIVDLTRAALHISVPDVGSLDIEFNTKRIDTSSSTGASSISAKAALVAKHNVRLSRRKKFCMEKV